MTLNIGIVCQSKNGAESVFESAVNKEPRHSTGTRCVSPKETDSWLDRLDPENRDIIYCSQYITDEEKEQIREAGYSKRFLTHDELCSCVAHYKKNGRLPKEFQEITKPGAKAMKNRCVKVVNKKVVVINGEEREIKSFKRDNLMLMMSELAQEGKDLAASAASETQIVKDRLQEIADSMNAIDEVYKSGVSRTNEDS